MPTWMGTGKQRLRAVLFILLGLFLYWVLLNGGAALVPFFLGAVLVYILLPVVDGLAHVAPRPIRDRHAARILAIVVVYIVIFGLLAALLSYFIPELISQGQQLITQLPGLYAKVTANFSVDIDAYLDRIPQGIRSSVEQGVNTTIKAIGDALQKGIESTVKTVWATVSFIVGMVIVPVWAFLVLSNVGAARRAFSRMLPESIREDVYNVIGIVDGLAGAYLRGQLILCLVIGAASAIMLAALGVPQALLLGTIAGILEVIPNLGPFL
ncbi:MAG: AI-2E family transporter, partial [Chloroflexi bacterium]|nr:AI-2E family transporter [Chloroflexota bacterium]